MPASAVATPAFCVTAPTPATAPDTSSVLVALSTSVSVPGAPWISPVSAVLVSVASSSTAPTSATATGASLVPVTVIVSVVLLETSPSASFTVAKHVGGGDPGGQ